MQNKHPEPLLETAGATEPISLSSRFDVGTLLAPDMAVAVVDGRPAEIDQNAEPVSMADLKPDPASTEARVALELQAAQAVLDAANTETLRAIAGGSAAVVAPQLEGNPSLLSWMKEQAAKLLKAADSTREAGGKVLYFTLTPISDLERASYLVRSTYSERSNAESAERNPQYGRHHVLPGRKSFLESRRGMSPSRGDYHTPTVRQTN